MPARTPIAIMLAASALLGWTLPGDAKGTGLTFVTSEKSSTLTVLNSADAVVTTVHTCARPRGIKFNPDRTSIYIACGDDDTVALYDVSSLKLLRRYRGIRDPETFALTPDGRHLYISNEDDSEASVLDTDTGEVVAHYPTGEEPEGVLITPDGKRAFVASEAASLVHVVDIDAAAEINRSSSTRVPGALR